MDLTTEVPQTGTRLRIDADRQFEGQPGDGTLRIAGEREGSQVFDATYVEVDEKEADLTAWLLRAIRTPTPELLDRVAQEVQATFSSKLSGREARQTADIMWQAIRAQVREYAGVKGEHDTMVDKLAERFERAAARRRQAFAHAGGGDGTSTRRQ